ncbi:ATP-grasp domain-containing protein [Kribbella soli]|uniref:ATP-grasp domain-containing protein n=1 Tax=Kribbella soli TaxID=1124743 RepID=A0A4R0H7C0_9ACTN|nr:ATP-grasp domain-containing protein [Kribbella soli]TCC06291.1 ATP-grasp domain-containing protein [Kribbella soli]
MTARKPTLAVVYDRGAVLPFEIARSLRPLAELVFVVPPSDHAQQASKVLRALGEVRALDDAMSGSRPDGVVTFSERMLGATSRLAADWGLPGHSSDVVELVTDKYAQRRRLAAAGVDPVRCHQLTRAGDWAAACDDVGLPAVLKPSHGEASRDTFLVHDRRTGADLVDQLLRRTPALVVEEYLSGRPAQGVGDYVSVESITSYAQTRHLAVTGKLPLVEPFRETGQFWPCQLSSDEQDEITALTGKALEALGITFGISHTEVKLTPHGPRIIEVNGRLGGHLADLALRSSNLDLVALAAKVALGENPRFESNAPTAVHFQHYSSGPADRVRVQSIPDGREVSALEGVDHYRTFVQPGSIVAGGTATNQLDFLAGHAPTHPEMLTILDQAIPLLTFEFTTDVK